MASVELRGLTKHYGTLAVVDDVSMLIEHGSLKRGYLGIAGQPVSLAEAQHGQTGREGGLLVVGVTPGSPAAAGGLLFGDIILDFDGEAVTSPDDLVDRLAGHRVGQPARLRVLRGGTPLDVTVIVGERH